MWLSLVEEAHSAGAPRQARKAVADQLKQWRLTCITEDVELVTSELVTNAIRHGGGVCEVSLTLADGHVHVEVSDLSTAEPRVLAASAADVGGRGILLVTSLCSDWGVYPRPLGKAVWADIPTG